MSKLKYQYGRLSYLKKSTGLERGCEDWWLTRNRDGTTTMRCLAMSDDSKFVRDVTLTRTKEGMPTDAFVRLQVESQLVGLGYFRITGDKLHIITDGFETGHTEQAIKIPTDLFTIVTHAVMLDGWTIFNYDRAKGGEQGRTIYNTSTRWNGTDGPLGRLGTQRINLLGEEEVTVPAGTFKATHFTIDSDFIKVPTSHLWVAGEDRILLRYDWGEFDHEYVLTSWKTEQR
ncbi:MAG: hypothetical protein M3X11_18025 [Acidobacteriota bacterium]|nr:hypothetical protein [Acidobacteriota bacterium]